MKEISKQKFLKEIRSNSSDKLQNYCECVDVDMIVRGKCVIHEGDISTEENWQRTTDNILILGSLNCDGIVENMVNQDPNSSGSLWILGNVICKNFVNCEDSTVIVDGDVTVEEMTVTAFMDSMFIVVGDFKTNFFYGEDIWVSIGGKAHMEYGIGYALPLQYTDPAVEAISPVADMKKSRSRINLKSWQSSDELVDLIRAGKHYIAKKKK